MTLAQGCQNDDLQNDIDKTSTNEESPKIHKNSTKKEVPQLDDVQSNETMKEENTSLKSLETEDPEKIYNESLSLFITNYHELINEITSNDKHKHIDWDNVKKIKEKMSKEIIDILEQKNAYPPSMKVDLERILQLAEISLKNHDSNSIIYIHRILHDLDVEYNNYTPNNKYGFSNYDSGGENQSTVSQYIDENYEK